MSFTAGFVSTRPLYAEVAVPVPIHGPLIYRLADGLLPLDGTEELVATPGSRVRITVGRRELRGVVLRLLDEPPAIDGEIKEIREVLDREPVLTNELLSLLTFTADYYLAPIGEVSRMMLPAKLAPWGERRVSLTNAGALAPPRDEAEARLVEYLLAKPRSRLVEVQRDLRISDLAARLEKLAKAGRVSLEEPGSRRGIRYVSAVELRPGELDELLEECGRSAQGRDVVRYLHDLGRPATLREVTGEVGCGDGVVRRLTELGLLRRFTQPERLDLGRHRLSDTAGRPDFELRPDQQQALDAMLNALSSRDDYTGFLLRGITGSGKTEVYLRAADEALRQGRGVVLLVPEIALVPSLARAAAARFGDALAILHSNLSNTEREQEWERLRRGEAKIVLGPRSALFAPLRNLGLVVVDEEHDNAYKQDKTPRYNGRDLALLRAQKEGAVAVLVSATPSLESRRNVELGKLQGLELTARAGHGALPEGILVDLKQEDRPLQPGEVLFSLRLLDEMHQALNAGDQIILLRNRRGYSPILMCRACGQDFRCEDCGLPFTYHRSGARLECHYCGRERPVPSRCSECGQTSLDPVGAGTERVEEQIREIFPDVVVDVLDADATRRPGGASKVLERFGAGETRILVGTQMVAKGHHFPNVALAAVLSADTYLGFPDFRAVERTYALLTQLAGRAGRGERPGRVVIQTFHPEHYAIQAALNHDDAAFVGPELHFRRNFHYPPYTRMVHLVYRHKDQRRARQEMEGLAARLANHPLARGVLITGPASAPLERLRGKWRFQLLLRSALGAQLRQLVREVVLPLALTDLTIDVDPYDLM